MITTGEICVRSSSVFFGYWGLKAETEYTFRNGWHHTGDIGHFDEQGYLWYVNRKAQKDLIKTGGENVYLTEVEKIFGNTRTSKKCASSAWPIRIGGK